MGEGPENRSIDKRTYMSQVITRAKSSVDPRKYTPQVDWQKKSMQRPNLALPREKKISVTEELIAQKKKIPGPSHYKKTEIKPKIYGFYGNTESKVSIITSNAFEKKRIPGPSDYESRGKSMSDILKDKAKKFLFHAAPDYTRTSGKTKKSKDPGPGSYEVESALERSASRKRTIPHIIPKAKNINFMSKSAAS